MAIKKMMTVEEYNKLTKALMETHAREDAGKPAKPMIKPSKRVPHTTKKK